MHRNSKSANSLHCFHSRKALLFVSLLFMITLTFSGILSEFNSGVSSVVLGASDKGVNNEAELRDAINNAPTKKSYTIAFNNDITLTGSSLVIPANKDITLTSNKIIGYYKLIGPSYGDTLTVEDGGVLKLDGIIITHDSDGQGRGVTVNSGGTLIMHCGEILGNSALTSFGAVGGPQGFSGGVSNWGVFEMYGGKISDNRAVNGAGGGVGNFGTFEMYGGEISNNRTPHITSTNAWGAGAGVYNGGNFSLSGGEITDNNADYEGGGVYNYGIFIMSGGKISGNIASDGGGVYIGWGSFDRSGGMILGNTARNADGENDVYFRYSSSGGSSNGNNGGGSGGNNGGGSGGSGSGGGSSNDSGTSKGGGYSLVDIVIVVVVVVGVVAGALFVYFKKKVVALEAKFNTISQGKLEA